MRCPTGRTSTCTYSLGIYSRYYFEDFIFQLPWYKRKAKLNTRDWTFSNVDNLHKGADARRLER